MFNKLLLSVALVGTSIHGALAYGSAAGEVNILQAGHACSLGGASKCGDGLICQDAYCKIGEAGACHDTPNMCIAGKNCVGKFKNDRKCKTLMKPGQGCKIDPYWVCEDDLLCENQVCKIRVGNDCSSNPDQCFSTLACKDVEGSKKCVNIIPVGDKCNAAENKICDDGLVCEDGTCKIPESGPCHDTPSLCITGKTCVGKFDNDKKCKDLMPPGGGCKIDPYWRCQDDLLCEGQVCKIRVGNDCSAFPDQCFSTLDCVDLNGSKKCVNKNPVGGTCDAAQNSVCEDGLVCENKICKIPEGDTCTTNRDGCATGLGCVGANAEKRCKTLMPPGGKCETDPFWFCQDGLVCENKKCRIPEKSTCSGNPQDCADGLSCVGANAEKRCKKLMPPNGKCLTDPFWFCEIGLECQDNTCRIPLNEFCTEYPNACVSGTKCVGNGATKKCKVPMQVGHKCNTDPFWVCEEGLSCEANKCKLPEGSSCTGMESHCVSATQCVNFGRFKKCAKAVKIGGTPCRHPWGCRHRFNGFGGGSHSRRHHGGKRHGGKPSGSRHGGRRSRSKGKHGSRNRWSRSHY